MARTLITHFGLNVLLAEGLDIDALVKNYDVIATPRTQKSIRFGNGFTVSRCGISTCRVLVGPEEHLRASLSYAWQRIGLRPISMTSAFGKSVLGKVVNDIVYDGDEQAYLVVNIFIPDTSGETVHQSPEKIPSIARHRA